MKVYVVLSTHYMGMDGTFTHIEGIYTSKVGADNKVKRLEISMHGVLEHEYDCTYFTVQEHEVKGLATISL